MKMIKYHHFLLNFILILSFCKFSFSEFEEKWFEQYLDHFNVWNNGTFMTRFFENKEFYRPNGPLILEIGAEETANPDSLVSSPSYVLAKRLHGVIVLLEHRFYGKSTPLDNENRTIEDIIYLNVDQALEDIALFVETYKKITPGLKNSKVAAFGCSYSASLATWFRYKFPHLVDAAWASSGPLRAVMDFHEYFETTSEMYSNVSSECIAIIRQGYREMKQMLSTPEGENITKAMFEGWECGNVTEMSPFDILSAVRLVISNQYNEPGEEVKSCRFLESKKSTTSCFEQLGEFVMSTAGEVCFEEDPSDDLSWVYQLCTQFGYSCTTNSTKQPFKDPISVIDNELEQCSDIFGENYNINMLERGIERMNRVYGSTNLKATRVLTVHGTHDPWHKLGLYEQKNDETPVLLIKGTSHCADMTINFNEPEVPQLVEARDKAFKIMENWLKYS